MRWRRRGTRTRRELDSRRADNTHENTSRVPRRRVRLLLDDYSLRVTAPSAPARASLEKSLSSLSFAAAPIRRSSSLFRSRGGRLPSTLPGGVSRRVDRTLEAATARRARARRGARRAPSSPPPLPHPRRPRRRSIFSFSRLRPVRRARARANSVPLAPFARRPIAGR